MNFAGVQTQNQDQQPLQVFILLQDSKTPDTQPVKVLHIKSNLQLQKYVSL